MINKDFRDFFQYLNRQDAEYLVIGGYAHIYYTEPRYTKDLDILVNPSRKNSLKIYKSLCDFFEKDNLKIPKDYFTFKHKPGACALGIGNPPNSIEIFTNIPGIKFSQAWKNKKSFKYDEVRVWVISEEDLEKNFKSVQRLSPKLAKKYGYFLDELKKWRKK